MTKASNIRQWFSVLMGFLVLGGLAYFVWLVIEKLFVFLENANSSVSAAIVGAMATILVGVGGGLYTQAQIKNREIEEAHRAKKVEIYKGFLDMVARIMAEGNENVSIKPPTEQELIDFLVVFKTDVILWGSPKVINAQLNFQKVSDEGGNVLMAVDKLFKAVREDIGLSNKGLNSNQLIKMYLKDPTEIDSKSSSNKALQRST